MTRLAVLLVLAGQMADAMTFGLGVRVAGIGPELDPFDAALYRAGGYGAVLAAKLIGIALMLLVLDAYAWERRRRCRPERSVRWAVLLAAGIGVVGAVTNVAFGTA